ncbi:cytochrome c-type biogenesis protein CcsB [Ammonifex degensii KC4]|uniref:Heme exporter protein C n=1 Tax=Ammonifex degensii (strain DSM 10501 / KC4) TaxID=429009 RepID=C9R9J5_AMMDK|nr:c-type cytochrome biogenesis protein CcsB [Ammonifex degensii]ACX52974.1 cytochrome c-type biogenesis protein CcsB [Ammonifex degensii KC4]
MLWLEPLAFKIVFGAYAGAVILYLIDFVADKPVTNRWATKLAWVGLLGNTVALGARIAATGRLPLANLYEYGLCFAWGIMLGYLLLQLKVKIRGLGVFTTLTSFLVIVLISLLPRETGALMPALRSKWLTYHVLTAIVAYSAFTLSFAAAVLYLIASGNSPLFTGLRRRLPDQEVLDRVIYQAVVIGLPFQTLLIVTGAIWAQYAWGAYWSWDPKETWSLITWLVYAAYLHARFVLGWRGRPAAYLAVAGFIVVIFTLFGVSFLMGGKHSYV